ncbi:hypothetical protein Ac2012v2_006340 [Leucoagaricus gongylophorus]
MELRPVIQSDKSRHQKLTESRGNWNDFLSRLLSLRADESLDPRRTFTAQYDSNTIPGEEFGLEDTPER